jgi:exportin-1
MPHAAVCLQILESVIKFRWAALPAEQREGIKNYISNLIIKYSTNEQLYRSESTFINKLNLILVQILKQVCRAAAGILVCFCKNLRKQRGN